MLIIRRKLFRSMLSSLAFQKTKKCGVGIWKNVCKRDDDFDIKNSWICSKHFSDSDYEQNFQHELLGYMP